MTPKGSASRPTSADLRAAVTAAVAADRPLLIWGPPGEAKTALIGDMAERAGATLRVLVASIVQPEDIMGVPVRDGVSVHYVPPPWAVAIRAALDAGRPAWLLLDELSCATPAAQAALLRVVQEREVAGVSLRGVSVLGAANPAQDAADGGWLTPASSGRWLHIHHELALDAWTSWAASQTPAHGRVAAYLRSRPDALRCSPEDRAAAAAAGQGCPSPRAWDAAACLIAAGSPELVGAALGAAAASEWRTWDAALDLPDAEDVLHGKAKLPERGDARWACLCAVAHAATQKHPERHARELAAWTLLGSQRPDMAVPHARAMIARGAAPQAVACDLADALRRLGAA